MNPMDRLWALGAAIVALGAAAGLWFGAVSPELDRAATAHEDRELAEHQNSLHETRLLALEDAASRIDEFRAERDELSEGIPGALQYPEFLRQLVGLAGDHGVTVTAVTSNDAQIYLAPAGDAASAPTTDDGSAPAASDGGESNASASGIDDPAGGASSNLSSATPEGGAEAPGAAPGEPHAAPVPYSDPRISGDNLAAVAFTVSLEGNSDGIADFLHELQMGERLVSISAVSLLESDGSAGMPGIDPETGLETPATAQPSTATISGHLYVLHSGGAIAVDTVP